MSNSPSPSYEERRKHIRIYKNFILSYYEKANPFVKYDISQLRNISKGGVCFITTRPYPSGTKLALELKTPYIGDTIHLEGTVLDSRVKVTNIIFETRLQFDTVSPQAEIVLDKIEKNFKPKVF